MLLLKSSALMEADISSGFLTGSKCQSQLISNHANISTIRGWDDISGTVNVTYFGDESPFELTTMWRKNNPKSSQRPFCVATRLGGFFANVMNLSRSF